MRKKEGGQAVVAARAAPLQALHQLASPAISLLGQRAARKVSSRPASSRKNRACSIRLYGRDYQRR